MNGKRRGVTMVEILMVIVIIAILGAVGAIAGGRQIARGHIDQTATSLEIFSANLEDAMNDVGEINLESADTDTKKIAAVEQYWDELSQRYLGFDFDYTTLQITPYGFSLTTKDYKDAWGNECRLFATTNQSHNRYTLASAGSNAEWSDATYGTAQYDDDILAIAVMK